MSDFCINVTKGIPTLNNKRKFLDYSRSRSTIADFFDGGKQMIEECKATP